MPIRFRLRFVIFQREKRSGVILEKTEGSGLETCIVEKTEESGLETCIVDRFMIKTGSAIATPS
jgi:hypothetical protein